MGQYVNIPTLGALLVFALILYAVMYFTKPAVAVPASTTTTTS